MKIRDLTEKLAGNNPILKNHPDLIAAAKQEFDPDNEVLIVKAPGRVNLIGEHTDYNMGPVLPCAIDKEIVLIVVPLSSSTVNVSNVDAAFDSVEFDIGTEITPFDKGHWGNYIKAGVKGIIEHYAETEIAFKGFKAIASGTLPKAAGLSSSSALVVVSALAILVANQIEMDKRRLAELCAHAEYFVGTAGGGMDQAASLLGKENTFLKMDFNPLRIEPIPAPSGMQLMIFHSLVHAEKSGEMREAFNRRVLECRMGVDLLNRFAAERMEQFKPVEYIGHVDAEHTGMEEKALDVLVTDFLESLNESYSLEEFLTLFSLTEQELFERYKSIMRSDHIVEPKEGFKIKSRFRHVFTECKRVHQSISCLKSGDMEAMGKLINASHTSLSEDYEISTPEVDRLVDLLNKNGALGARIMGAGFGGVVIALTTPEHGKSLVESIMELYYKDRDAAGIENPVLACVVGDGAGEIQF